MEEFREMINKLLVIFVLMAAVMALFCSRAHAQGVSGFAEVQTNVVSGEATPELNVYFRGPVKGKLGWTAWSIGSKGWSEGLAGLAVAPTSWMEIQGLVGVETDENPVRGGFNTWFGKGRASFLSLQEYGGSGYWCRYLGTFEARKGTLVGVNYTRFIGVGPYIEQKVGKITVWGSYAPAYKKGIVTGRFNF